MLRRLLILSLLLLSFYSYLYLPNYNLPVVIIVDTLRIDSSVLYLSVALLIVFIIFHWLLTIVKWLRKAPTNWQKYRHLQRLEKHQKLRDSALIAYIEQRYEQAEGQFKQCHYYQNELQADNLFAAKMALLQKDYSRAEQYLENQSHPETLAHLIVRCDLHAAQNEYALITESIKQYHRHHKPTTHTNARLLEALIHTNHWEEIPSICAKLPKSQQEKWQQQVHLHTMLDRLNNQQPQECLAYFKRCSYQEKQDPALQTYAIAAHILLDELPQALQIIKTQANIQQQPFFSVLQILTQFSTTHAALQTWLEAHSGAWVEELKTLMAIKNNTPMAATGVLEQKNLDNYVTVESLLRAHLMIKNAD